LSANGDTCTNDTTLNITVNPIPDATVSVLDSTICSGTVTNITASSPVSGATFTYTVVSTSNVTGATGSSGTIAGPLTISQTLNNLPPSTTLGTVQYIITPFANGCPGLPDTALVNVEPKPTVGFSLPNQALCSGDTSAALSFSSTVAGVQYQWSANANGVSGVNPTSNTNSNIPSWILSIPGSATTPDSVVVTASATINGCPGVNNTYTIVVNPIPQVTNLNLDTTLCTGVPTAVVNFNSNLSQPLVTSYSWQLVNANGVSGAVPTSGIGSLPSFTFGNPSNTQQQVVFAVVPISNGCVGDTVYYTYNVDPGPTVDFIPDQSICSGDAITSVTPTGSVANTTYSWAVVTPLPAGVTQSTTFPLSGTVTIPAHAWINANNTPAVLSYVVTPSAAGCPGLRDTFLVVVNPTPYFNNIPSQTICSGASISQVNLSATTSNTVFTWTMSPPSGIIDTVTSGTSIIPSHHIFNTTSAPITLTYQI
ncbi:MAG: PKD-like domain-containing protein, partial [Bacteroidota bacterium]